MSSVDAMPPVKSGHNNPPSVSPAAPASVEFHYTQTDSFVALLQQLGASLLVSTYQANKLIAVRASGTGLSTLVRTFERPMGLAADSRRLTIAARREVHFLRNAPDIAPQIEPAGFGRDPPPAALPARAQFGILVDPPAEIGRAHV